MSHALVKALGIEPVAAENYELINGEAIRTVSGPGRGQIRMLPLPPLCYAANAEPITTLLDPAPEPERQPRAPRPPRGPSRKYGALVKAARELAPLLPPEHSLRRALDALDLED